MLHVVKYVVIKSRILLNKLGDVVRCKSVITNWRSESIFGLVLCHWQRACGAFHLNIKRYLIKSIDTVLEPQSCPHDINGPMKSNYLIHVA